MRFAVKTVEMRRLAGPLLTHFSHPFACNSLHSSEQVDRCNFCPLDRKINASLLFKRRHDYRMKPSSDLDTSIPEHLNTIPPHMENRLETVQQPPSQFNFFVKH
jgi:hypothetical protein